MISPVQVAQKRRGFFEFGPEISNEGTYTYFWRLSWHQVIGEAFGSKVGPAKSIMHGKVSKVTHSGIGLFRKIPSPYTVTRYHSLALLEDKFPECLEILARTDDQEIMAIRHRNLPFYGVQFHPEAILTDYGYDILQNFMEQT
ncbi:MAG: hypothetical protein CM15mP58_12170 [Burkholderiaceae bacterium]|nr:MAG: hypothetical protein CM15mP58_12170 [Burkholderiaceae bacterium]